MTKLQKLEKAKKESLEKWQRLIDGDPYTWVADDCGFCKAYACGAYQSRKGTQCPVKYSNPLDCSSIIISKYDEDLIPFALAVMVYIHGFTVADLPEEK